ncbi:hypothetical protein OROMI_003546 [Orobanche minor]
MAKKSQTSYFQAHTSSDLLKKLWLGNIIDFDGFLREGNDRDLANRVMEKNLEIVGPSEYLTLNVKIIAKNEVLKFSRTAAQTDGSTTIVGNATIKISNEDLTTHLLIPGGENPMFDGLDYKVKDLWRRLQKFQTPRFNWLHT